MPYRDDGQWDYRPRITAMFDRMCPDGWDQPTVTNVTAPRPLPPPATPEAARWRERRTALAALARITRRG